MKTFEDYLNNETRKTSFRDAKWYCERDRRRTREELKMRKLALLTNAALILTFIILTITVLCVDAESSDTEEAYAPVVVEIIPGVEDSVPGVDVNAEAQEPVTYEDWFRENAISAGEFKLTHYCAEERTHICGTGDGITSTGVPVTPYWTCAVDPSVIPYGAEVMVDYGDRVEFWKAQDCGGSVKGNHLDLAVESHDEALEMGIKSATVYWVGPEDLNERF